MRRTSCGTMKFRTNLTDFVFNYRWYDDLAICFFDDFLNSKLVAVFNYMVEFRPDLIL